MSGITNKTGAVSGIIGTTVGSVVLTGHVLQTIKDEKFNENSMKFFEKCYILLYQRIRNK